MASGIEPELSVVVTCFSDEAITEAAKEFREHFLERRFGCLSRRWRRPISRFLTNRQHRRRGVAAIIATIAHRRTVDGGRFVMVAAHDHPLASFRNNPEIGAGEAMCSLSHRQVQSVGGPRVRRDVIIDLAPRRSLAKHAFLLMDGWGGMPLHSVQRDTAEAGW